MSNDHVSAREIELVVAEWLGVRQRLIVPNVSWGMHLHECDLLALSRSGWATEIEIKVSKADLKRDGHKHHQHRSHRIQYLYFAMPRAMRDCVEHVPIHAGIILVHSNEWGLYRCEIARRPIANPSACKFTADERLELARLGAIRIWSLKRRILEVQQRLAAFAEQDYSI